MNFDKYLIEGFLHKLSKSTGRDKIVSYINICKLFEEVKQRFASGYEYNVLQGCYEKSSNISGKRAVDKIFDQT